MADEVERVGAVLGSPYVGSAEVFFERIRASGVLPAGIEPAETASAVLCALSARLTLGEARDVIDALPEAMRGLFSRCAARADEIVIPHDAEQLVGLVGAHMGVSGDDAEAVTRVVLRALRAQLPAKEVRDVERQLPRDLVALWHQE